MTTDDPLAELREALAGVVAAGRIARDVLDLRAVTTYAPSRASVASQTVQQAK
jgi:hypothetical protein